MARITADCPVHLGAFFGAGRLDMPAALSGAASGPVAAIDVGSRHEVASLVESGLGSELGICSGYLLGRILGISCWLLCGIDLLGEHRFRKVRISGPPLSDGAGRPVCGSPVFDAGAVSALPTLRANRRGVDLERFGDSFGADHVACPYHHSPSVVVGQGTDVRSCQHAALNDMSLDGLE